jgi:hypothetical protein
MEPDKVALLASAIGTMAGAAVAAPQVGLMTSAPALVGLGASSCVGIGGLLAAAPLMALLGRHAFGTKEVEVQGFEISSPVVEAKAVLPRSGYLRRPERNIVMQIAETEEAAESAPEAPPEPPKFDVKKMPGITAPLGFFDPAGFCNDASEGKIRFYREVELKHGRVAMLASLGFLVAEKFHPLWGGNIDVPSYIAFQETPLQGFWPAVVFAIAIPEVYSVFSFQSPFGGETWAIRTDHEAGDLGFDPLGLKPEGAIEFAESQTKELNNGRLAMLAVAGMIAQELATGQKL